MKGNITFPHTAVEVRCTSITIGRLLIGIKDKNSIKTVQKIIQLCVFFFFVNEML